MAAFTRRRLVVTLLVLWVVAGPLAAAFGPCAAMGDMCEGPCAAGLTAPAPPASGLALPLVDGVWHRPAEPAPAGVLRAPEPPPKPLLSA